MKDLNALARFEASKKPPRRLASAGEKEKKSSVFLGARRCNSWGNVEAS